MFERYTEPARRAIFFARYEAGVQHAEKITTAHLLLGLVREGGPRVEAIVSLKANATQLRAMLGAPASAKPPGWADLKRDLRLTDDSKRVLAYASQEASAENSNDIDTDHLLLGLLCFPNEAATALQSWSVDLATARLASRAHRAEFPNHRDPFFRFTSRPLYLWVWSAIKLFVAIIIGAILVDVALNLLLALFRWFN
jgi:ATP-dependent Clp protease ATP-binding subunit ClpA